MLTKIKILGVTTLKLKKVRYLLTYPSRCTLFRYLIMMFLILFLRHTATFIGKQVSLGSALYDIESSLTIPLWFLWLFLVNLVREKVLIDLF
jgi:hypothetical protein